MKKFLYYTLIIISFQFGTIRFTNAQATINKEVEVVKPYEPVVSDAYKINILPKIADSVIIHPNFEYNIQPKTLATGYEISRINAAKMVSMPLTKLYKSYLKLGLGNYSTPLAELYINSLRSKKHEAGVLLNHQSSGGKIGLNNGKNVYAGYSETSATLFGKKYIGKTLLYGNGSIYSHTVNRYGYNTDSIYRTGRETMKLDTTFDKGDIRQNYLTAAVNAGIRSNHNDSSKIFYDAGIGYQFFRDRYKNGENDLNVHLSGSKAFDKGIFGINTSFTMFSPNSALDSMKFANTLLRMNPWVGASTDQYRLHAGFDLSMESQFNKTSVHLYPVAELNFNVVNDVLIAVWGVTGAIRQHGYENISVENPFITPGLQVKNTNMKISYYGALKGSLGSKASYIARVDFSKFKNDYFFVNDTATIAENQFAVVYDNTDVVHGYFEAGYEASEKLNLRLNVNYYQYTPQHEEYAWHKQNFDITFSSKYNLRNKILLNVDIIGVGKRYAKSYQPGATYKTLPGVVDFNLGLEYRYTKILSVWLKFNNFTASKYEMWNQYPAQRFNMMAGLTYSM